MPPQATRRRRALSPPIFRAAQEMFPSYDRDVLGSILAMHEGQFEAMEALLEMGDPDGGGGAAAVARRRASSGC